MQPYLKDNQFADETLFKKLHAAACDEVEKQQKWGNGARAMAVACKFCASHSKEQRWESEAAAPPKGKDISKGYSLMNEIKELKASNDELKGEKTKIKTLKQAV